MTLEEFLNNNPLLRSILKLRINGYIFNFKDCDIDTSKFKVIDVVAYIVNIEKIK